MAIIAIEGGAAPPDPPSYVKCVALLQAKEGALHGAGGAGTSTARLRHACEQQESSLRGKALAYLISAAWLTEGAREANRGVSNEQAEAKLSEASTKLFKSPAEYQNSLKRTGRTVADALFELEVNQASENLRSYIRGKAPRVTAAEIADKFDRNPRHYSVPELRDLNIVRVGTESEALKVRKEIVAGRSFASVAKGKPDQPVYSHNGFVKGLAPGAYAEPKLSDAIFAIKPNTLSKPVGIALGYFVFEVKRVVPPHRRVLADVRELIRQELTPQLQKRTFARFVRSWRAEWKSRTHCRPGFVIANCSESKLAPTRESEGPYALA